MVYQFDNSTQNFGYIQRITTTDPTKPEAFFTEDTAYVIFAGAFVETVTEGFEHKLSALYKWEGKSIFTTTSLLLILFLPLHLCVLALYTYYFTQLILFIPSTNLISLKIFTEVLMNIPVE